MEKTAGKNNDTELHRLLLTALLAARDAGRAILEVYDKEFDVEYKDDKSPLTLADKRAHEIIMEKLSGEIPILSEEGREIPYEERSGWKRLWIVDPLDGTKEFIKRNGEFTVNIALAEDGRPTLGVVHAPVKDVFYYGLRGLGAYRVEGKAIEGPIGPGESLDKIIGSSEKLPLPSPSSPSSPGNESSLIVIGSRSHATPELTEFVEKMKKEYDEVEFISAGSSLKFCLVAEGTADVYPRFGPTMEWDTAAGQAVVENAGGTVIEMETGEPLRYNREDLLNPWFMVRISKCDEA